MSKRAKSTWIYTSIMILLLLIGLMFINTIVGNLSLIAGALMAVLGIIILIWRFILDLLCDAAWSFRDWWHSKN